MLRSMYSGVSGMRNFQTKMDVIANNIANVNTTAFKSGRAKFQDLLNQSVASAQAPQAGRGGVNPQQIGLGVRVGSIDTIMEGGAMQPTNRGLDFAIAGEGFFKVSPDKLGSTKLYTRDGAFYVDAAGNLTNSSGLNIIGYKPDDGGSFTKAGEYEDEGALKIPEWVTVTKTGTDPVVANGKEMEKDKNITETDYELQSYSIDGTGTIKASYKNSADDLVELTLGQISVTTFSNPSGLTKDGGNNYIESENSGPAQTDKAGTGSRGVINQGFLEMSNVDLANEFTEMIVTSRAYQANSRSITTSDEMIQELLNLKR